MIPDEELISRVADDLFEWVITDCCARCDVCCCIRGGSSNGLNKDGGEWTIDELFEDEFELLEEFEQEIDGIKDCGRFVKMICAFSISLRLISPPPTTPMIVDSRMEVLYDCLSLTNCWWSDWCGGDTPLLSCDATLISGIFTVSMSFKNDLFLYESFSLSLIVFTIIGYLSQIQRQKTIKSLNLLHWRLDIAIMKILYYYFFVQ